MTKFNKVKILQNLFDYFIVILIILIFSKITLIISSKEVVPLSLESLGKLIKKHRNTKGYLTQLLAERLTISAGLLNNIENARTDSFNLKLLNMLIKKLNIPIEELKIFKNIWIPTSIVNNDYIDLKIPINFEAPSEEIKTYIKNLVDCYLNTAISCDFNESQLYLINSHLLEELNFIKKRK